MVLQPFDSFKIDGSVSNWNPVFVDAYINGSDVPGQITMAATIEAGGGLYRTDSTYSDGSTAITGIVNGFVWMPINVVTSLMPHYSSSYGQSDSGFYIVSVKTGQEIKFFATGINNAVYFRNITCIKKSDTKLQILLTHNYPPIENTVHSTTSNEYTITKDFFENGIKFRNKIGYCYSPSYGYSFTCKFNPNGQITKF